MEAHEIAEKIHEVDEHAHAAPDSFRKFTGVYVGFVAMLLAIAAMRSRRMDVIEKVASTRADAR